MIIRKTLRIRLKCVIGPRVLDSMGTFWPVLPGAFITLFTLREVFQDLFHPSASGSLSEFLGRKTFQLMRRWPRILSSAGPLALVIVIFAWAVLIALGFALIYYALLPGNFKISGGRPAMGFWPMMYFSFEVMTTLGLGDYAPEPTWLRLLVVSEALFGFAMLTASVSSIVLIHPPLGRVRTLARQVFILVRTEQETGLPVVSEGSEHLLEALAFGIARTRVDFVHFPVLYYFRPDRDESSLPYSLPHLLRFAIDAQSQNSPALRRAGAILEIALRDLSHLLKRRFLQSDSNDCALVFQDYARDHLIALDVV